MIHARVWESIHVSPTERNLATDAAFRRQAREFAKSLRLQQSATMRAGKIAAEWLEHYSRTRNAEILANALFSVTGVRVTGRTLRNYRDIYLTAELYKSRSRRKKSGNDFHFQTVASTHLLVVARADLTDAQKIRVINAIEMKRLTVSKTKALVARTVVEANRQSAAVNMPRTGPRVIQGDAIDIVAQTAPDNIHHLMVDWQWDNTGVWRESMAAGPVHRPDDPIDHLCRYLEAARPHLNKNGIVWIFSKATAFPGGQLGLPWAVQKTANRLNLRYCSEFISPHRVAGYRNTDSFLATAHTPIHPYVTTEFDLGQMEHASTVGRPWTSPNHVSQHSSGKPHHPYEKPVELFENLIRLGVPGGLVFDGFAGSGSSAVAAIRSGCSYLGAEMQPHFVRIANQAIANAIADQGTTICAS